jgi:hypothetical protein
MIEKFPNRPKGMHEKTFRGLRSAHDRAAERCMLGLSSVGACGRLVHGKAKHIRPSSRIG